MKREEIVVYLKDLISPVESDYVLVGEKKIQILAEFEFEIKYKSDEEKKKTGNNF